MHLGVVFNSDYFFCIPGYLKERAHNFALMMTNVYNGSNIENS